VLISILLGGSFLGPIPFAVADEDDDDRKEKLKKLKVIVNQIFDDEKCKKKHKYKDICDEERPEIEIDFPERGDRVPAGEITITGTASDEISGIKKS